MRRLCTERTVVQNKQPEPKIKSPSTNTHTHTHTHYSVQTHLQTLPLLCTHTRSCTHTHRFTLSFYLLSDFCFPDSSRMAFVVVVVVVVENLWFSPLISWSIKGTAHGPDFHFNDDLVVETANLYIPHHPAPGP